VIRYLAAISLAVAVLVAGAATASAQSIDVPRGYKFCGWKDLIYGGWTYEDPEPGVYTRLFARKKSCGTARRNYRRVGYTNEPAYRPTLRGHRCKTLEQRHEYADVRCSRMDRPKASVRWQTGA
jgi:hypothetical protein